MRVTIITKNHKVYVFKDVMMKFEVKNINTFWFRKGDDDDDDK